MDDEKFWDFVTYVKYLQSKSIPIIIAYWWGSQISSYYKQNTSKERPKWKDGTNITSEDVLNKGVLPAYEKISQKLADTFWDEALNIFSPDDIQAEQIEKLWYVWKPVDFTKPFSKEKINIVPFVWDGLNINADDIVWLIAQRYAEEISNILFFTWTGGVLNNEKEVVPFISKESLQQILDWEHQSISVEWGMYKKLRVVYDLLESWVKKVTVTQLSDLKDELETVEWTGTMFVDLEKAVFEKCHDMELFKTIYSEQVKQWNWKERNNDEVEKLASNYIFLLLDGTVLWGYSLQETEINWNKWKVLECMFSCKSGWWIWGLLWKEICKQWKIFAYSEKGWFFEKLGFKKVEWNLSKTGAQLYEYGWNVSVIWSWWAVWVDLGKMLKTHPQFKGRIVKTPEWLSKMKSDQWEKVIRDILESNEVTVLAVHDDIAKTIMEVKRKYNICSKILDCSTAHRIDDDFTFWLPEIWQKLNNDVQNISNPWCHSTAVICSLAPLSDLQLIDQKQTVVATSTTWYSGWWKEVIKDYETSDQTIMPANYSLNADHKHNTEIKKHWWISNLIFTPQIVDKYNGLMTHTIIPLTDEWKKLSQEKLIKMYKDFYETSQFMKVSAMPDNWKVSMDENNWTQKTSIYIQKQWSNLQVVCVLDNMMKGSAWAVIQNLNLIFWYDEALGLEI